jgi:alginate O-acetyltransferase complex protein AlgJ
MRNRTLNAITAVGFLLLASLPLLRLSPWYWYDPLEKRKSAPFPALPTNKAEWLQLPAAFEAFFNDHFGYRQWLIDSRNAIDFHVFRRSPNARVVIGKDNWLFYTGDDSTADFMGQIRIQEKDLAAWYSALTLRRDWLKARGIDYHFILLPNKQMLYPEYMPTSIVAGPDTQRTQILAYMARRGEPNLIEDMYPVLAREKGGLVLYHPLDSHWNPYGAWIGYRAIAETMTRANPAEIHPLVLTPNAFAAEVTRSGDLATILKFERYPNPTTTTNYIGPALTCGQPVDQPAITVRYRRIADNSVECRTVEKSARALFFLDSMIDAPRDYLGESFFHVRFVRMSPSLMDIESYVRAEHPAVVIEERMERELRYAPLAPPAATVALSDAMPPRTRAGSVQVTETEGDVMIDGFSNWHPDRKGTAMKINTNLPVDDVVLDVRDRPEVETGNGDAPLKLPQFTVRLYLRHEKPSAEPVRLCIWTFDPEAGSARPVFETHADWDTCVGE